MSSLLIIDSPVGLFSPGMENVGDYFQNMWKDAEEVREKWSCEYLEAVWDCFVAKS